MALHVALTHRTEYDYDRLTGLGPQIVRLRPAPHCRTPILSYSLKITPKEHFINWQQDPHGNYLARLVFPEQTREFRSRSIWSPTWRSINPFDFFLERVRREISLRLRAGAEGRTDALSRSRPSRGRCSRTCSPSSIDAQAPPIDFSVALNQRLQHDIGYVIRMEPGVQTPEETLSKRTGSCRDSRLAAGADAAPSRPRGALRLRLPDPAQRRT